MIVLACAHVTMCTTSFPLWHFRFFFFVIRKALVFLARLACLCVFFSIFHTDSKSSTEKVKEYDTLSLRRGRRPFENASTYYCDPTAASSVLVTFPLSLSLSLVTVCSISRLRTPVQREGNVLLVPTRGLTITVRLAWRICGHYGCGR